MSGGLSARFKPTAVAGLHDRTANFGRIELFSFLSPQDREN
jgi:hypothetical protein